MARARGWKKHPSPNLRDARAHRGPLGKPRLPEWQTAGKMSLMVVEGHGPKTFAEIATRRALTEVLSPVLNNSSGTDPSG